MNNEQAIKLINKNIEASWKDEREEEVRRSLNGLKVQGHIKGGQYLELLSSYQSNDFRVLK